MLQVGCTGGGSNFAGLANPFIREKLAGKMSPVIRAVEPAACPSLTRGSYQYDYGDAAGTATCSDLQVAAADVPQVLGVSCQGHVLLHGMSLAMQRPSKIVLRHGCVCTCAVLLCAPVSHQHCTGLLGSGKRASAQQGLLSCAASSVYATHPSLS